MNRENPAATPQRKRQISKCKRGEDGLGLFRGEMRQCMEKSQKARANGQRISLGLRSGALAENKSEM